MGRRGVTGDEFIVDIFSRFKDDLNGKVIEDFNRLQLEGNLDEYLAKFEELKALTMVRTPQMPDTYFLGSIIGGLKPATKPFVRATHPQTLDAAIEQARFHEEHVAALKLPFDRSFKPHPTQSANLQKSFLPTPNSSYKIPPPT